MTALNFAALAQRLLIDNKQLELVKYIFDVQGAAWCRLDYRAAASSLHVDKGTVSRYVDVLANKKVILLKENELKLNDEILKKVS